MASRASTPSSATPAVADPDCERAASDAFFLSDAYAVRELSQFDFCGAFTNLFIFMWLPFAAAYFILRGDCFRSRPQRPPLSTVITLLPCWFVAVISPTLWRNR